MKQRQQSRNKTKSILSPRTHQTHEKGPEEDKQTGIHAFSAPKEPPALVTEEVLRQQFDERGKCEQTGRDGIHNTNHNETNFGVGTI